MVHTTKWKRGHLQPRHYFETLKCGTSNVPCEAISEQRVSARRVGVVLRQLLVAVEQRGTRLEHRGLDGGSVVEIHRHPRGADLGDFDQIPLEEACDLEGGEPSGRQGIQVR